VSHTESIALPRAQGAADRRWLVLAAWGLFCAAIAVGFSHSFAEMWSRWFPLWDEPQLSLSDRIMEGESYYTHGPLIPLLSGIILLLLIRKTEVPTRGAPLAGLAALAFGVLLHLTAVFARVNFAQGFSLIFVLVAVVLTLWGWRALGRFWFPLALLVFMAPLPEVTIYDLNFRLKMMATQWGVSLANVFGVLADYSGNRVYLPGDKSLVVANVCNGLRTLISLLAFGALYAYISRMRGAWRMLLFAASVPVAVISNAVRIALLVFVADLVSVEAATGWFHDVSGLLIYAIAFALLFGLERLILWGRRAVGRPAKVLPLFHNVRRAEDNTDQERRLAGAIATPRGAAVLALLVLNAGVALLLHRQVPTTWTESVAANALPPTMPVGGRNLIATPRRLDRKTLGILETDDYFYSTYTAPGAAPMDFCIIFSHDNRKGTHPPDQCLAGGGERILAKADVLLTDAPGRGAVSCRELVIQSGTRKMYFLYTYKCGDAYTNSFWVQQATIFANGLLSRDASGALIRLSTPVDTDVDDARRRCLEFLRAAVPHLDENLK